MAAAGRGRGVSGPDQTGPAGEEPPRWPALFSRRRLSSLSLCGQGTMSEAEQQLAAGATQNGHEAAESSGEQQAETGGAPAAAATGAAGAAGAAAAAAAGAGPAAGTAGTAASQNGAEGDQINASKNEEDAG